MVRTGLLFRDGGVEVEYVEYAEHGAPDREHRYEEQMMRIADPYRTSAIVTAAVVLTIVLSFPQTGRAQPDGEEYEGKVIDGMELLAEVYRAILQGGGRRLPVRSRWSCRQIPESCPAGRHR